MLTITSKSIILSETPPNISNTSEDTPRITSLLVSTSTTNLHTNLEYHVFLPYTLRYTPSAEYVVHLRYCSRFGSIILGLSERVERYYCALSVPDGRVLYTRLSVAHGHVVYCLTDRRQERVGLCYLLTLCVLLSALCVRYAGRKCMHSKSSHSCLLNSMEAKYVKMSLSLLPLLSLCVCRTSYFITRRMQDIVGRA